MALGTIFDIAGTGMNAQSLRLNTTASNLANAQSASSSVDEVYRSRQPVFAAIAQQAMGNLNGAGYSQNELDANAGVQVLGIVESDAPLQRRYEPGHPKADADGYVFYPNVNPVEEMANMISASRSFQMNVEVMNSAKQMVQRVLTLGQ
ncbi:flagellar basal body rod protein FlgC [Cellvibrio japonicus]|uniref:Flagellar basal-body rod protein FlgC n=1 Tax=Cellvibrio japonicus (strain Ueda107) TaxID=498211 RepID=B3PGS7_CELJU|nr:flagellar basal body rod protein FlgC [Cellvibrio japonicus]ACE86148.1 flagellar basal-body rod protein FlgC [Cellvibrio japonicus Ueda107]QEI12422.1 flagellar basal body rod protein FlgC [Cellvibrio japonicus]QEI15995.1 flagellar basal body rod protein FlgC [Cellvibrio japonicus]QEI19574.1 flagellar basal body rod protein FlgC [Cellvibrio japonicus]